MLESCLENNKTSRNCRRWDPSKKRSIFTLNWLFCWACFPVHVAHRGRAQAESGILIKWRTQRLEEFRAAETPRNWEGILKMGDPQIYVHIPSWLLHSTCAGVPPRNMTESSSWVVKDLNRDFTSCLCWENKDQRLECKSCEVIEFGKHFVVFIGTPE